MRFGRHTAILADGSLASLIACAMLKESLTASEASPDSAGLIIALPSVPASAAMIDAARLQAQAYDLPFAELPPDRSTDLTPGEAESRALLAAVHAAARARCDAIIWPVSAARPDGISLDRVSACADRALLVGRLVAIDATEHGLPGLTVTIPFIDLSDRQIADLAVDMAVPIETCWWNRFGGTGAAEERKRWMAALRAAGRSEPARA